MYTFPNDLADLTDETLSKVEVYCSKFDSMLTAGQNSVFRMRSYTDEDSIVMEKKAQDLLLEVNDLIDISRLFFILHMNSYKE